MSHRVFVGVALLLAMGCSSEDPPEEGCDKPCASGAQERLAFGRRVGSDVVPFTAGEQLMLVFGPQGGQHVFVDTLIESERAGKWDVTLEVHETGGAQVGGNQAPISVCECRGVRTDLVVFMNEPEAVSGVMTAKAVRREDGYELTAPPVDVSVAP